MRKKFVGLCLAIGLLVYWPLVVDSHADDATVTSENMIMYMASGRYRGVILRVIRLNKDVIVLHDSNGGVTQLFKRADTYSRTFTLPMNSDDFERMKKEAPKWH